MLDLMYKVKSGRCLYRCVQGTLPELKYKICNKTVIFVQFKFKLVLNFKK